MVMRNCSLVSMFPRFPPVSSVSGLVLLVLEVCVLKRWFTWSWRRRPPSVIFFFGFWLRMHQILERSMAKWWWRWWFGRPSENNTFYYFSLRRHHRVWWHVFCGFIGSTLVKCARSIRFNPIQSKSGSTPNHLLLFNTSQLQLIKRFKLWNRHNQPIPHS